LPFRVGYRETETGCGRGIMAVIKCVHCGVENDPAKTGGYCDDCGKKLPGTYIGTWSAPTTSSSSADSPYQMYPAAPPSRGTFRTGKIAGVTGLLFIAGLHLACGLCLLAFYPRNDDDLRYFAMVAFPIGVVFAVLGMWARYRPLLPIFFGFVIYLGYTILLIVAALTLENQRAAMNDISVIVPVNGILSLHLGVAALMAFMGRQYQGATTTD